MGYKRKPTLYRLKFADEPGFDCAMRSLPIGDLLAITGLQAQAEAGDAQAIEGLVRRFASAVVEWNLEDDQDVPVPTTYEGLAAQDMDFLLKLINGWVAAVSAVDTPLPPSSNGGPPPGLEESIPMAPLPASPAS